MTRFRISVEIHYHEGLREEAITSPVYAEYHARESAGTIFICLWYNDVAGDQTHYLVHWKWKLFHWATID